MARINLSPKERFKILKRDNFTCRYCGRTAPAVKLHVDHVKPVSEGGTNARSNLIAACADCNFGKGAEGFESREMLIGDDDARQLAFRAYLTRRFKEADEASVTTIVTLLAPYVTLNEIISTAVSASTWTEFCWRGGFAAGRTAEQDALHGSFLARQRAKHKEATVHLQTVATSLGYTDQPTVASDDSQGVN